jgi:RNA polymerase sigma-70 factor, ECF subfamily
MNQTKRTDEELICASCDGCREAFGELTDRYRGRLVRFVDMASGGAADSESVVQESLMRAYVFRHSFRKENGAGFASWMYTITRNEMAREFRKPRPLPLEYAPAAAAEEPEEVILRNERLLQIRIALGKLPRLQRESIVLFRFGGLSSAEAAGVLGTSEGAVRTAIYKGLKSLRKWLIDHEGDEL